MEPLPNQSTQKSLEVSVLRDLLEYDHASGLLTWKERGESYFRDTGYGYSAQRNARVWNSQFAGQPALCYVDNQGYRTGRIFGAAYKAHRVAWAIHYGEWPNSYIDHINGNKTDNRICNLRDVTPQESAKNLSTPKHNSSGHIGVSFIKKTRRWRAYIKVGGKYIELGRFQDIRDAISARKNAELVHNFHANHGRIAIGG